jgi:hypothetical protein
LACTHQQLDGGIMSAPRPLLAALSVVLALAAITCSRDTPQQPSCTYSVGSSTSAFTSAGGQGAITLGTPVGCAWTVTADSGWVAFPAGSSGSGPATIAFTVAANPAAVARKTTLTIAGHALAVSQDGHAPCEYAVSPSSLDLIAAGGSATVTVTAGAGCDWTATSGVPWVTVTSGSSGTAGGTVGLAVTANTAAEERQCSVTVADRSIALHQAGTPTPPPQPVGCEYAVSPVDTVVHWHATAVTIGVSTSAGCPWNATPSDGWLSIDRTSGSGPASITASFQVFTEDASRSAAVQVRWPNLPSLGQNSWVTQEGCRYGFETTASLPAAGGARMLTVVMQPLSASCSIGCPWTATSNAPWIHVTSSMPRAGDDAFTYQVDANAGAARVGTLTIAGRTHTVTQAGS